MGEITAIVLAAGGGTRMAPLASEKSKVMLWILGKPTLEYVLSNIKEAQVKKVIIVVLEKTADQIIKYFTKSWNGLDIDYVRIKKTLGPSYALNEIKDLINTPYFLTQYADSITKENLIKKVLNVFESNKKVDGVLALREVDDPTRYGIVKYKNNKIVGVIDKPGADNSPSNHAVMGTFILNTELFKKAIDGKKFIFLKQLFPAEYMLKRGAKMKEYFFDGKRVDVGKPEDLFNASMLLSSTPTKCVVFDADNTLYNTHQVSNVADKEALKILAKEVNINVNEIYNQWQTIVNKVKNSKIPQKRTRKFSYGVILKKYKRQNLEQNMYQVFENTLLQKLEPIGKIQEILTRVPQEKILVTEDERELALKKLKAVKLFDFFDQIITSTETKTMKPAEKFYDEIFKKYEPEEVLFVGDDYKKDLEIPSKMGSKILFVDDEDSLLKLKNFSQKEIKKIHIMGAAGAGASAVAGIAKAFGYNVTACDINPDSAYTKNLEIRITTGHNPSHLKNIDLLITSPAVEKVDFKNPELLEAKRLNIPTISWQQFQGDYLQKDKFVITVAGAYGKSTTTSMIAKILIDAGLDPTCEVGAEVLEWQNNFRIGKSRYYICESDEYNNNFLNYHPDIA
ncbi:MAG: HAD-IA family hydrolase, partial [Candidatus Curtissbacteria bacterium]|nr:HAD-IA family hydrolase [Candidatus Curtissbacteria bacterium]